MKRLIALALSIACFAAWAAGPWVNLEDRLTPEQRRETGLDGLSTEQLALLNRLLREQAQDAAAGSPAPGPASAPAFPTGSPASGDGAPRPVATVPADAGAGRASFFGFDEGTIATQVVGTVDGWEPGTEFALANGQRWKVLKGKVRLPAPRANPDVRIVPGAAGRWFFRIDEDTPGARVYRID